MTNPNNETLDSSTTSQVNPESHDYHIIYANLMDGEVLLVSATLDYITDRLDQLLTGGYNTR